MMSRGQLIREVARRTDYTIAVCDEIIKETFNTMADELEGHGEVRIPAFGRFVCKMFAGRHMTLPSGDSYMSEDHLEPKFLPSATLKQRVRS